MFERFTQPARQAIVDAQDEARNHGHNYVGTEHLLVALLRDEESIAFRVLDSKGIHVADVMSWIASTVGRGGWGAVRQLAFTPRAKQVVELSLREAVALGHEHVGPEHVLLALTRLEDGLAARIMVELGPGPRPIAEAVYDAIAPAEWVRIDDS
jgi:ATP-dependent Clp protease ATP-binding subunit ClpC